ncbi:SSI family serine proteinase inhibitor, partial [Streptomyces sp. NPDC057654]|uniref:SSI family serine proteinase inhibitor n=1 Tax=Streptomyces sp. NPDC057654 TaxID=3346196 RepID=UPI00368D9B16
MSLRRLAVTATTAALLPAALLALPTAASAATAAPAASGVARGTVRPLPVPPPAHDDHLTVTVSGTNGTNGSDGTYELYCHPAGGTHPHAKAACDQLDGETKWGKDTFAPVPTNRMCTQIFSGPEQAHVSGSWAGRPVDADFKRTNGCET